MQKSFLVREMEPIRRLQKGLRETAKGFLIEINELLAHQTSPCHQRVCQWTFTYWLHNNLQTKKHAYMKKSFINSLWEENVYLILANSFISQFICRTICLAEQNK